MNDRAVRIQTRELTTSERENIGGSETNWIADQRHVEYGSLESEAFFEGELGPCHWIIEVFTEKESSPIFLG